MPFVCNLNLSSALYGAASPPYFSPEIFSAPFISGRLRRLIFHLKNFQRYSKSAQRHVPYFPESCRKMHLDIFSHISRGENVEEKKNDNFFLAYFRR
jgi:hypothetical protein